MENKNETCCNQKNWQTGGGTSGAIYGLGLIGAAYFFISEAGTFWIGVLGFLKALVWPAFLVYEAFKFLIQ